MNPRSIALVVVLPALAIMASSSPAQFPGSALRPAGTGGSLLHDTAPAGGNVAPVVKPSPAATRAPASPQTTADHVVKFSPRRLALQREFESIRDEQNRLAQEALVEAAQRAPVGVPAGTVDAAGASRLGRVVASSDQVGRPRIFTVNGRTSSVRLTPGGRVVITGLGLGNAGTVRLDIGYGLHPLQVVYWSPVVIDAWVPANLQGVRDTDFGALEIYTAQKEYLKFDHVQFVAARAEITVTSAAFLRFFAPSKQVVVAPGWPAQVLDTGEPGISLPDDLTAGVTRKSGGRGNRDCPAPGVDEIHFLRGNGFDVVGAAMSYGRTDSGDGDQRGGSGSRVFTPGYDFGDWTDESTGSKLQVRWGVFRSHTSPGFSSPAWDWCSSEWRLTALTLYGPAGVTPP